MTAYDGKAVSPLMSKVSQESGLRVSRRQALLNPVTARTHAIVNGDSLSLTTAHGTMTVEAKIDASATPNVILVSTEGTRESGRSVHSTDDVRLLCDVSGSGSYCPTPATLLKVHA
jgi:hypothetical protein